jgi:lactoylglutathione lyase
MNKNDGTHGFVFNQTMLRVRDPAPSIAFYSEVMGMSLVQKLDFPELSFSLYFLAYLKPGEQVPTDAQDRAQFLFGRDATLELTHNWGTESDPAFAGYHNGNAEPRGFGHLGVSVPDVDAACERFEDLGVRFIKRPSEGKLKGIAFIADPDGYWIEILSVAGMASAIAAQDAS